MTVKGYVYFLKALYLYILTQAILEASRGGAGEALLSTLDLDHSRACDGQFSELYQPLHAVGKGAFGFVWQACRRSDGEKVRLTGDLLHFH